MDTQKTIEQRIDELEKRVALLDGASSNGKIFTPSKEKKLSAKEFLMTKMLETGMQTTLALAYYLEQVEGMESFNTVDVEAIFRAAKEKLPQNINDVMNKNVARGLLMEAKDQKDAKKAWVLTSTGEKYVEEELKN